MIEMLPAFLFNLLHWGVEGAEDSTARRKVMLCNFGALVAVASAFIFDLLFLDSGVHSARLALYAHLPFYPLFGLVFWLNRQHMYMYANWLLVLCAMCIVLGPMYLAFGSYLDHHHYFIMYAAVPIIFFPSDQKFSIAFVFVLNVGLFVVFEIVGLAPADDILSMDGATVTILRTMLSTMVILTLAIFYWIYDAFVERGERELEHLSTTDVLTKLLNRRHFESDFKKELAKAKRFGSPVSIAFIDIDYFKKINDTYGHGVGDMVIKHVSRVMQRNMREGNILARFGGDEFVVLFPNTNSREAVEAMERVRKALNTTPYMHDGAELPVTISVGVSEVDVNESMIDANKRADDALYAAKQAGRDMIRSTGLAQGY